MKDFYDYLEELDDDIILNDKKFRQLEAEQEKLRKEAIAAGIAEEDLYEEFFEEYAATGNYEKAHRSATRYADRYALKSQGYYDDDDFYNDYEDDYYSNTNSKKSKKKRSHKEGYDYDRKGSKRNRKKEIAKRKRRKKLKNATNPVVGLFKWIIKLLIFLLIIVLGYMFWKYQYLQKEDGNDITTSSNTGFKYTNVALFGLDSRDGELEEGVQSDTIIVASINNITHDVKLVSVLRDSFLELQDGSYNKINAAFNIGGAEDACSVLNKNLDLDIKNYMVIDFEALIRAIDAVGGLDLDMTSEEVFWLNGYQLETARTCGMESEVYDLPVQDGIQHVNGVQATAYCRIRYIGTDVARTNRQRIVLQGLIDKLKHSNPLVINYTIDAMFPYIATNMSYPRFASLGIFAPFYKMEDCGSFPFDVYNTDRVPGYSASYVIPSDLSNNVVKLHNTLFEDYSYTSSDSVNTISNEITNVMGY